MKDDPFNEAKTVAENMARECIAARVRLVNRIVSGIFDRALRPHGIKVSQANILVVLSIFGQASPSDVCAVLQLEKSTLSRNTARMRKQGWLEAGPGSNSRDQILRLSPEGARLLIDVFPAWRQAQAEVEKRLGSEGLEAALRMAAGLWPQ